MRTDAVERQLTHQPHGHILTNSAVWSPDGQWIVYDVRSDAAGSLFDGSRIERVHIETGEIETLFEAKNQACVGVATCSPVDDRVVFIHGPKHPTPDWAYNAYHRQGVIVNASQPGDAVDLDARDLTPPFTLGALRGGTHVHTFDGRGEWVAFTYEDHVLATNPAGDLNQRNVGVSAPIGPVSVSRGHPRNHDGTSFSVLVTRTVNVPKPGSDEIKKAYEDAWIGRDGYRRSNGTWQHRALAFLGDVISATGATITELFVVDLPDDVRIPSDGPLEGTSTRRPCPPHGAVQRRLTNTADRRFPGIQGPRHWPRSSPDGGRIAFLMKDDAGVVQLWSVSPNSGEVEQVSRHPWNISSAFTWSPDGRSIAHVMDNSMFVTDMETGEGTRLTPRSLDGEGPRPEACVFSPDGSRITYVKPVRGDVGVFNQVFCVAP
ncbi:MAG: DUF3748 domain-containing protein [Planctomycetes bacterium]|nr:DUF3748 domain-containing protein [Planctomycetota bacterium]